MRDGYGLVVNEEGGKHADTEYITETLTTDVYWKNEENKSKDGVIETIATNRPGTGTNTNIKEELNEVELGTYAGVSNAGSSEVAGNWNYIIQDNGSTWTDLRGNSMPSQFVTVSDGSKLQWSDTLQTYTYNGEAVDYSNVYVIGSQTGVFTNSDGSLYTGSVYGRGNEVLMTAKQGDKFYSFWASKITDKSATMETYRVDQYEKDLDTLVDNDKKLFNNDIEEVQLNKSADEKSATIQLVRNSEGNTTDIVDGAITVTGGGGTDGDDTYITVSSGEDNKLTLKTGSVVTGDSKANLKTLTINKETYNIVHDKVQAGYNVTVDDKSQGSAGETIYKVSAYDTQMKAGDSNVIVTGGDLSDKKVRNYEVKLSDNIDVTTVNAEHMCVTKVDETNGSSVVNKAYLDNSINNVYGDINKLDDRVNRVGAGAAALAALHPLDFDPDDKWDFAAGYGNYRGANATAVGAYYRPNEDTMFSVGGAFGGGENLVNVGFSVKLGRGSNNVTTSKVAMAKELKELRSTIATQAAQIEALTAMVNKLIESSGNEAIPAASMAPSAERYEIVNIERDPEVEGLLPIERVRAIETAE